MDRMETLERIKALGLLAVLRGPSADLTFKVVDALIAGGVYGIEITFTTPDALQVVKTLSDKYGDEIVLGMGTLVRPEQANAAKLAGAMFLVSPHCDDALGAAMRETELPMMMGAFTPTEVMRSVSLGSDVVKVFPGSVGGPAYLKALKGPFPEIPMMPTGGVNKDNVKAWFDAGAVAVGAGSQLCPTALVNEGRFGEITTIAQDFVNHIKLVRSH